MLWFLRLMQGMGTSQGGRLRGPLVVLGSSSLGKRRQPMCATNAARQDIGPGIAAARSDGVRYMVLH